MIRNCACSVLRGCGPRVREHSLARHLSPGALARWCGSRSRQRTVALPFASAVLELVVPPALHLIWKGWAFRNSHKEQ